MNDDSSIGREGTIFALSSGPPPAAIAVIRISGAGSASALDSIAGGVPAPRRAALRLLRDPADGSVLDQALVLWLPGPNSETGEDTAEFQVHGGRAVIAAMLRALGQLPGFRLAEPGEFTRRAFDNGRLDLTSVEGLADLVAAETEGQRRQAVSQAGGALKARAEAWRRRLVEALALTEAALDFSDEGDVEDSGFGRMGERSRGIAAALAGEMGTALEDRSGERVRDGLVVAVAGPPNAGKSSLFNLLLRREAAIVSPHAGTTRDVLEASLDIGGFPVTLLDMAGIRVTTEAIEAEGVRRAEQRTAEADIVLWMMDVSEPAIAAAPPGAWMVFNKMDRIESDAQRAVFADAAAGFATERHFAISVTRQQGIDDLVAAIARAAGEGGGSEPALITRARHRALIQAAHAALRRAAAGSGGEPELFAEDLRAAAAALGRLTGRIDVDDVLAAIFSEFCIGK